MSNFDWLDFLTRWSLQRLERDVGRSREGFSQDARAANWPGFPIARESLLEAAEQRLGVKLPPSYREFFSATNGWRHPDDDSGCILLPVEEIDWLSNKYPEACDDLVETAEEDGETWLDDMNNVGRCLGISSIGGEESHDRRLYLLNPFKATADGEWEALFISDLSFEVQHRSSFGRLMRKRFKELVSCGVLDLTGDLNLPADLIEFLAAARELQYDRNAVEAGHVTLHALRDLRLREVYITATDTPYEGDDPKLSGTNGYYAILGVSLVATRKGRADDDNTLLWFPNYQEFGQWDREHNNAIRFMETTWSDIAADPARYLDAKWTCDHPKAVDIQPWKDKRGVFRPGETP